MAARPTNIAQPSIPLRNPTVLDILMQALNHHKNMLNPLQSKTLDSIVRAATSAGSASPETLWEQVKAAMPREFLERVSKSIADRSKTNPTPAATAPVPPPAIQPVTGLLPEGTPVVVERAGDVITLSGGGHKCSMTLPPEQMLKVEPNLKNEAFVLRLLNNHIQRKLDSARALPSTGVPGGPPGGGPSVPQRPQENVVVMDINIGSSTHKFNTTQDVVNQYQNLPEDKKTTFILQHFFNSPQGNQWKQTPEGAEMWRLLMSYAGPQGQPAGQGQKRAGAPLEGNAPKRPRVDPTPPPQQLPAGAPYRGAAPMTGVTPTTPGVGPSLGPGPSMAGPSMGRGPALPMGGPSMVGPSMGGPAMGGPSMGGPVGGGPVMGGGPSMGGPSMGGPSMGGPSIAQPWRPTNAPPGAGAVVPPSAAPAAEQEKNQSLDQMMDVTSQIVDIQDEMSKMLDDRPPAATAAAAAYDPTPLSQEEWLRPESLAHIQRRMLEVATRNGISTVHQETIQLIALATRERLLSAVGEMVALAKNRVAHAKAGPHDSLTSEPRRVLAVIEKTERDHEETKREKEREDLVQAAKKQKAALQKAGEVEKKNQLLDVLKDDENRRKMESANAVADAAIGLVRKPAPVAVPRPNLSALMPEEQAHYHHLLGVQAKGVMSEDQQRTLAEFQKRIQPSLRPEGMMGFGRPENTHQVLLRDAILYLESEPTVRREIVGKAYQKQKHGRR